MLLASTRRTGLPADADLIEKRSDVPPSVQRERFGRTLAPAGGGGETNDRRIQGRGPP